MLTSGTLRANAKHILSSHAALAMASLALAALIGASCALRICDFDDNDGYLAAIIWLPMAAFTRASRVHKHRDLVAMLSLVVAGLSLLIVWQFLIEGHPRPRGLSFNVLTGPMLMAMVCLLSAIRAHHASHPDQTADWISTWISAIGLTGTIVSQSRTALMAFVAAAVAFVATCQPGRRLKPALLAICMTLFWGYTQVNRYEEGKTEVAKLNRDQHVSSVGERSDGLRWGWQHLFEKPWLGLGPKELQDKFNMRGYEWGRSNPDYPFMAHLHNDYLQLAIEHGIPAMLCHLGMWLLLCKHCIMRRKSALAKGNSDRMAPWVLAMCTVYLAASLTDSFMYWVFTWATALSCLGIAAGLTTPEADTQISP
jgi:O-antigen ligase